MGWRAGAWATGAWAGTAWATQSAPTEIPDVVGEIEADGTTELEGAGFVVSVSTAYSASVPVGVIISQSPVGGSFAQLGSTVTITVSLGPQPVTEQIGGHYWPTKSHKRRDYRAEQDEQRQEEQRELRELIERAAGLIEEAEETAPAAEVAEAAADLEQIAAQAVAPPRVDAQKFDAVAWQAKVNELIAAATDELIVQVADLLTELIQEIADDDD